MNTHTQNRKKSNTRDSFMFVYQLIFLMNEFSYEQPYIYKCHNCVLMNVILNEMFRKKYVRYQMDMKRCVDCVQLYDSYFYFYIYKMVLLLLFCLFDFILQYDFNELLSQHHYHYTVQQKLLQERKEIKCKI